MDFSFYPLVPVWVVLTGLAVALGLVFLAFRRGRVNIPPGPRWVLFALRCLSLVLLALMLLCPGRVTTDLNVEHSQLVFLLDDSASMGVQDQGARQTRLQRAAAFVADHEFAALRAYPRRFYAFNHAATPLAAPGDAAALKAAGGTDFRQVFQQVDKDVGFGQLAGIVLLSDGLDHSEFTGEQLTVPIYSVMFGTDLQKTPDAGIGAFKYPAKISDREELTLDLPLLLTGYPTERALMFTIEVDGESVFHQPITLTPGKLHHELFTRALGKDGVHLLRLHLEELGDEVSHLNNTRELAIEVVKARHEIVAFFPLLTNSFRPLLREFERDEENVFTAVYQVSPGVYRLRGYKLNPAYANGVPAQATTMRELTCFVLAATNGSLVNIREAQVLERYVSEGGSLIILGGSDSFGELAAGSPLARLSPAIHLKDSGFTSGRFTVKVDHTEETAFSLKLRELVTTNTGALDFVLPSINHVQELKNNTRVLLWADDGTAYPLVVWQPFGKGRVVAVLSNAFHLWGSTERRDENFGIFWRQLISFARNLDDDNDLLKIATNKTELLPDDTLKVTALARHPNPDAAGELVLSAELYARGEQKALKSATMQKLLDTWNCEFSGLAPGRYTLRVTSADSKEVLRERYRLLLVGEGVQEQGQLATRRENFLRFSGEHHLYDPGEVTRLEDDLLKVVRRNEIRRERFLIFEGPAFFLALALLLLFEWYYRRRHNLF